MALTYWAGNRITGLSTDTKPTNVPDGTLFNEIDGSRDRFIFVGGTWHKFEAGAPSGGINYTVDVFTSSGTYNKPSNLDYCYVLMVSGGSGGGAGRRGAANTNRGAGGSMNGGAVLARIPSSLLPSSHSVTVGSGGSGASATTTNDTNGSAGSSGGATTFINISPDLWIFCPTSSSFIGSTVVRAAATGAFLGFNGVDLGTIIASYGYMGGLGFIAPSNVYRGNFFNALNNPYNLFNATSIGGQIRNNNDQVNAGTLAGFYDDTNTLIGEMTGTAPEAGDGAQPTEFYTFGQFLARLFPWFDPADANYNIGRGGLGGGCGDLDGTIPGGKGGDAVGYGAGGGGGGASTNGANSGAGGDGSDGIVIIINVLTD